MKTNKTWTLNTKICTIAVVLWAVLVAAVFAQNVSDFSVELTGDGSGVRIKGYTGSAREVVIPEEIEGLPVREIGDRAFYSKKMYFVVIPSSVTAIGEGAFQICEHLSSVTIPSSVTAIGQGAFQYCVGLRSITIPDSVTVIGSFAFSGSNLTSITIPNSVTEIGSNVFSRCYRLVSIELGTGITAIPDNFASYAALVTIVIPEGITNIRLGAFQQCEKLQSLTLPSTIKRVEDSAFAHSTSLNIVIIPDSVETIAFGYNAFYDCPKLNIAAQAALRRRGL